MISRSEATKMVEKEYVFCNISEIIEKEDCYYFNLVRKDNGMASVWSPITVDKRTGEMARFDFLRAEMEEEKDEVDEEYLERLRRIK